MKFLFIDTNIWVRIISQGKPGCEVAHLDELRTFVEESKLTLLLPEVVKLEFEKNWRLFTEEVKLRIGKLEKELETPLGKSFWSEIEDVQKAMKDFLADQKEKKITAATERHKQVESLLALPSIVVLPFTQDIYFRGKKRLMAGRMPKPENIAHSDACIIESLAEYFSKVQGVGHEFYFCSENVGDFGLAAKDRHIIHPLHKDELPPATEYFISLEQIITFFKSNEKVQEPSAAVIEEALQQRTEDEIEAEREMTKEKSLLCGEPGCSEARFVFSRYCQEHFEERFSRLSSAEKKACQDKIDATLKTLTYKEREIIKLRWGLGDGYTYTVEECGRIFKITALKVRQIESKAVRKLQHPVRRRHLDLIIP